MQVHPPLLTRTRFGLAGCVAGACLLGASHAAFAGAGVLTTTVSPLQGNVTYSTTGSKPLNTYIGYTVTISNDGGNTINNIRFSGTTAVTDPAEKASYSSAEGATCSARQVPSDGTVIDCSIGQLTAGRPISFVIFFKAPTKEINSVADGEGQDSVAFGGQTFYAEGTGGSNSVPDNSIRDWTTGSVTLGTFNPERIKSAVPKSGGTLFTGNGIFASSVDPFATQVVVPPSSVYTTAEIKEAVLVDPNCSNFLTCFSTQLNIPGTFAPYLSVVLSMDKDNIKSGTKIGSVLLDYIGDDNNLTTLSACASPTTPRSDNIPCIARSVYYKNRSVPGWTTDRDGDFEWTLISLKNGLIRAR
jgi:hypothetical protein